MWYRPSTLEPDGYDAENAEKRWILGRTFEYGYTLRQHYGPGSTHAGLSWWKGRESGSSHWQWCLFRGGKDKAIRSAVVSGCRIELLFFFQKSFSTTRALPGAILISDKTNPLTEEKVLIYKCSQEYHSILDVRKLNQLPISNIDKIVKAYREFKVDGFSRIVGIDDLQDNYLT